MHRKVLLVGRPKSAGKTTFATSAPGPILLLNYDHAGVISTFPGGKDIHVRSYPSADPDINLDSDKWVRPTSTGKKILSDIRAIRAGFESKKDIDFGDGEQLPLPTTLILDGMSEMTATIVDWILAMNKKQDADDFNNKFALWQKRMTQLRILMNICIPLPCNVILTAHEDKEIVNDNPTGKIIPDLGGKLDNMVPGKVDSSLRLFTKYANNKVSYYVQTKPDAIREWIGVRNRYDLLQEIDVTIDPKHPVSPWQTVFGKEE